jgi:hypothetical protein
LIAGPAVWGSLLGGEANIVTELVVLGDGVRSGDSRQWGFIPADQALGLVVRKLTGPQPRTDTANGF